MKHKEKSALEMLQTFTTGGKPVKDLSRFAALCDVLENPQNALKFIHVAGTNGKGSVSEFMSHALVNAGVTIGKFTSPYIYNIRERIQLQNKPIAPKDFERYVKAAITAATSIRPAKSADFSQFEILTAAAFLYFQKKHAEMIILETGIGGLLDCTNIVTPEISVITAISYDHADILGGRLSEIAAHKAGIIKPEIPCVMYPIQERAAYVEIKNRAEKAGARLIIPDMEALTDEKISVYGNEFVYKKHKLATAMGGRHQVLNALTAYEVLDGFKVAKNCIASGFKAAKLPARMEIIRKSPLIVLDGAHNRQGIAAAKAVFETWRVRKAVVFGTLSGKDYMGAIEELYGFAHFLVLTDGFAETAVSCTDLYHAACLFGFDGSSIFTVGETKRAVELAAELCGGGMVLVTGSLRLAGGVGL
ncbi:MAG: Mur ligase family protein [Oscillospiraceae bacterium]|nr:Mur ligase family protein [Oscillospiraceae bacterium]